MKYKINKCSLFFLYIIHNILNLVLNKCGFIHCVLNFFKIVRICHTFTAVCSNSICIDFLKILFFQYYHALIFPHEAERASSTSMTNCMPSPEIPGVQGECTHKQNFYPRSIFQVNHYKLNNFISTFIFLFRFALICTCSSAIHNTNTREREKKNNQTDLPIVRGGRK